MSADPLPPRPMRLFARLRLAGFDCECPGCGKVAIVRTGVKHAGRAGREEAKSFDELTGVWTCRGCWRKYVLGLVFHPISSKRGAGARQWIPPDQVPTVEQARALRKLEQARDVRLRGLNPSQLGGRATNRGPLCTCPEDWQGRPSVRRREAGCPRHGAGGVGEGGQDGSE